MKRIITSITFIVLAQLALAQGPNKLNYQGIARNATGAPIGGQALGIRLTVHDLTATGTTVYQETHNPTTNAYGLYNLAIGGGTVVSGSMNDVSIMAGDKYLQVEIDATGGINYVDAGTTQLLSVPFALKANKIAMPYADSISDTDPMFKLVNKANGDVASFKVNNTNGTSAAVTAEVNSIFANYGTAAVLGISSGTGGYAGYFHATHPAGNGAALTAVADGNGDAIRAAAANTGYGLEVSVSGSGRAIYGYTGTGATGQAARLSNFNVANATAVVQITNAGTGTNLLINHTGSSGNLATFQNNSSNVARIDKTGKGFFNGGTQASGADLAEAFDVTGTITEYETGDVLAISTNADRTVERSSEPYSTLVAGVYATKPGVLLTEENISTDISGKVPMGVVGVLPTKVCMENGAIKRGDMIVTSSLPGVAMKADPDKVKPGQVIGKALENYNGYGVGKIKILVNVK